MKNIMKKTIFQCFVPALLFTLVLISCDEYLDIDPKGYQLLETTEDYDEWLNSEDIQTSLPTELYLLGDEVDQPTLSISLESAAARLRAYAWQQQFSEKTTATPIIWAPHYQSIYYFNTVIQEIDGAEGTEEEKERLKAEALLGRAFEYLYLVNLYGKVYDVSTASEDLAVPFVTSNDLADDTPDRSTVQEIYDHIIEDITTAISDLPADNSDNRFRGSVAAAYSVLARTYLYMSDYTKAAQNAQLAIDNSLDTILDYSTMSSVKDIPHLITREDAIYARLNTGYVFTAYPNLTFLQSFDRTDLRLEFFYTAITYPWDTEDYSFTTRGRMRYSTYKSSAYIWPNWGTSAPEMRLILAEAAARSNDLSTACDELDLVRKCRFPSDTYVKYESSVQEEVLQKVLDERKFEFAFRGLRWFDMRRLDAEGRMETVYRYDGDDNVIATLSPGSNKYTLQIPIQVLYFNQDWEQNTWDEE